MVLLSAPAEVVLDRVATRRTNDFGKTEAQRRWILEDLAAVEPLLRAGATAEIDTRAPLDEVVDSLERIASTLTRPRHLVRLVAEQVVRAVAQPSGLVVGIQETTRLQREAPAPDAGRQAGLQCLEGEHPLFDLGVPAAGEPGPVALRRPLPTGEPVQRGPSCSSGMPAAFPAWITATSRSVTFE